MSEAMLWSALFLLFAATACGACLGSSDCTSSVDCAVPYCNGTVCALQADNTRCDDGDPCTVDTCNVVAGCSNAYTQGCLPPQLLVCATPPSSSSAAGRIPAIILICMALIAAAFAYY